MASRKMKGGVAGKINKKNMQDREDNFTVRESGGTVRSLSGLRSGQVSEILFMDKESKTMKMMIRPITLSCFSYRKHRY